MATVLEKLQAAMLDPSWSRRRLLGRVVQGSAAVAAAAAGVVVTGTTVAQAYTYGCCNLAYGPPFCANHSCGSCSGGSDYVWYCTADPPNCYTLACGECYTCGCSYAYKVCNCC